MPEDRSVLDKALSLQSEARRLDFGRKDEQQAQRIRERVHDMRAALGDLRIQVRLARVLKQRTGMGVDLSNLDTGRRELARKAAGGLPSDRSFNTANQKIKETTESLSREIMETWKGWAESQLSLLPVNRISMLGRARQAEVRSALGRLREYARSSRVTATDISLFTTEYEGLKDELDRAPDAPEPLLALLDRLSGRALTLRDVTDEEIAFLRQYSMDQEIEVRRRSS